MAEALPLTLSGLDSGSVNVFETLRLEMTTNHASGPVRYSMDTLEGAFIHPHSGHLVYVPTAAQQGTQTLTIRATDGQSTAVTTIPVTVGAPVTTVQSIIRQDDGSYTVTFDRPDYDDEIYLVRFLSITDSQGVQSQSDIAMIALVPPWDCPLDLFLCGPESLVDVRHTSYVFGSEHPKADTIYYLHIEPDGLSANEGIYAQFTPGQDGFRIIPNPASRPIHHAPDINITVQAGGSVAVKPELLDNDGNALVITGVTSGTKGMASTDGATLFYTAEGGRSGGDTATYTVTDNMGRDVNGIIAITISINPPPVVEPIGDIVAFAGQEITFQVHATDVATVDPGLNYILLDPLPPGENYTKEILDWNSGYFSWTPDPSQIGEHTLHLRVWDGQQPRPYGRSDQNFTITVLPNPAPVIEPIDDITASVGETISFNVNATDIANYGYLLYYIGPDLPPGVSDGESILDKRTGHFNWTPDENQTGVHTLTLLVWDGQQPRPHGRTFLSFDVMVHGTILEAIPTGITIPEHKEYTFDADFVEGISGHTFGLDGEPDGAQIDPATGAFSWTPSEDQGGHDYTFTVTAVDGDGQTADSQAVTITVAEANLSPAIEPIDDIVVTAGLEVSFFVIATDMDTDGSIQYIVVPPLPPGVTGSGDILDRNTGHFSWTPDQSQLGVHPINLRAWDGTPGNDGYAHQSFTITTKENPSPIIEPIDNIVVSTGQAVSFNVSATDEVTIGGLRYILVPPLPPGVSDGRDILDRNTGHFDWTPDEDQRGVHTLHLRVWDGQQPRPYGRSDQNFTITVNGPILAGFPTGITIPEHKEYTFDADFVEGISGHTFGLDGEPDGAQIDPATGVFSWTPTERQGGRTNTFKVIAMDSTNAIVDEQAVTITVSNLPPTVKPVDDIIVRPGEMISFQLKVTDENANLGLRFVILDPLPPGVEHTRQILNFYTGYFEWVPDENQVGVHPINLRVSDGDGQTYLSFNITVGDNPPPVIDPVEDIVTSVGQTVSFDVSATDIDTIGILQYYINPPWPPGVSDGRDMINQNTGHFSWTPDGSQTGTYTLNLLVWDGQHRPHGRTYLSFNITVNGQVLGPIPNHVTIPEHEEYTFDAELAEGVDVPGHTFDLLNAPDGAEIDPATGRFGWTPSEAQGGQTYTFTVIAVDGAGAVAGEHSVAITVAETNAIPVIDPIDDITVSANQEISFYVNVIDTDEINMQYFLDPPLPPGVSDSSEVLDRATGQFIWTPNENHTGVYPINLRVWDGHSDLKGNASQSFNITVLENTVPVISPIDDIVVSAGQQIAFHVVSTDKDIVGGLRHIVLDPLPPGVTDGRDILGWTTGYFKWTPDEDQTGVHTINLRVWDGQPRGRGVSAHEVFTITVNGPVLAAIPTGITILEQVEYTFDVDLVEDANIPGHTFGMTGRLDGAAIHPATGVFSWTPSEEQGGQSHTFTIVVMDSGGATVDDQKVTITVNQNPEFDIADTARTAYRGESFELDLNATDDDIPKQMLTCKITSQETGTTPAWIDPHTCVIRWIPADFGDHVIRVQADDDHGGATPVTAIRVNVLFNDTKTPEITLNNATQNPQIIELGDDYVELGATASDDDPRYGGAVTTDASMVDTNKAGTYTVTYTAPADPAGKTPEPVTRTVTVRDTTKPAIALNGTSTQTVDFGQTYEELGATVTDNDPEYAGTVSIDAPEIDSSIESATYTVTYSAPADGAGNAPDEVTRTVMIGDQFTVPNVNPVAQDATLDITEDSDVAAVMPGISDPDDSGTLEIVRVGTPSKGTAGFNSTTNTITYKPSENKYGQDSFDYTVQDNRLGTDTGTIYVTITPVNDPPELEMIAGITMDELVLRTITLNATDVDNTTESLVWIATGAPAGLEITGNRLTWTPSESQGPDYHSFAITVSDGASTDSQLVTFTVNEVNQDPVLNQEDVVAVANVSRTFQINAIDADIPEQPLTYRFETGSAVPPGATLNRTGYFSWTPTMEHSGTVHTVTVTVTDDRGGSATGSFVVTVQQYRSLLMLGEIENRTIPEMQELAILLNATGADAGRLTYTATGAPAGLDITGNRLTWTPAEDQGGRNHTFTVTVSDGTDTDSQTVVFTVRETNQDPVITAVPQQMAVVGQQLTVRIMANDADDPPQTLSYRITGDDLGAGISGNVVTWTPDSTHAGSQSITVLVEDDYNPKGSATVVIPITVNSTMTNSTVINRDPAAPDILINAELFFPSAVTPAVTDPDGDDTTITHVTEPTLGTLDTGMLPQISYTPSQTGIDRLNYTASDNKGGTDTGTITIFINPEGNARPVLDHIYNIGGRVGVDLNFTAAAADVEGDPLTFDLANAPDGAGITAGGDFSWRPTPSQNGTHTVTFVVHDDSGGADWQHVLVTVLRADETNLPPAPQDIDAGVVLGGGRGFQPDIVDPEGDVTEIVRVYDSSLGDIDRSFLSQGIIVYVAGVLGDDEVVYTVSDGRGGFTNGTISITVEEPANVRPLIDFVGDKSVNAGDELTFTVDAEDLDGFVTGFELEGETQGPSMSPLGVFSWTPTANDVGRHEFTILVFDDAGENSTVSITVTVRPEDFENSPPVAPDVVIMTPQDVLSIVRPTLTDPDEGDPVRITQTGDTTKGSILTGFLRAGIIIYLPNQGETGTETITYTISDSSDETDTATINVFISARGNTDPILGSIDFRNINAGNPLTFDLEGEDPDGDAISYQTVGAPDGVEISPEGAFSWMPTAADVGNHTFTIVAYDDRGGADSKTAVIRVLPAGTANQAPNAPDSSVSVTPGGSIVITPVISDPDGDRVTITDAATSGTGVVIQSEDSINYIHVATTPTETITYTVTDARGATSTGTITVTIQ